MVVQILLIGLAIALVAWYAQRLWRRRRRTIAMRYPPGLDLLAIRYARGEIDRTEYLQKRGDILERPLRSHRQG